MTSLSYYNTVNIFHFNLLSRINNAIILKQGGIVVSQNEVVKITTKQIKGQFLKYGIALSIYGFILLITQHFLGDIANVVHEYLLQNDLGIQIEYVELSLLLIIILGSFVPMFVFSVFQKIKYREYTRDNDLSFIKLMSIAGLLLGVNLIATFAFSLIGSVFGQEMSVMMPIGVNVRNFSFTNPLFLFIVVIITPIFEELIFRGVSLRLLGKYGNRFAIITVSILFGLAHGNIIDSFPAMIFSSLLCLITLRYKSIYPSIVIHMLNNALFVLINILIGTNYVFVIALIVVIYIIGGYTLIKNYKNRIVLKKEKDTSFLLKLFFSNIGVIAAIIIFICSSFVLQFIL